MQNFPNLVRQFIDTSNQLNRHMVVIEVLLVLILVALGILAYRSRTVAVESNQDDEVVGCV